MESIIETATRDISSKTLIEEKKVIATIAPNISVKQNPTTPPEVNNKKKEMTQELIFPNKFILHHPKASINLLVDSAAYLFSVVGKLKQLKSYRHLNQLQKELIEEINQFQETAKAHHYNSDFILVSRYALCVMLDDILSHTHWGTQGQWENYRLQTVFNNEPPNYERFFLILERIVKDPSLYIDLMELMYLCLSLGFKGNYRTTEFGHNQLEQITDSLYKRIRSQRGNFSKALSPFPLRLSSPQKTSITQNLFYTILSITAIIILSTFVGLGYMLDSISNQAYQELIHIRKL